ncbi:MAG: stage II sporulation protein M [Candidatus Dormibacteria bacterium]
MAPLRGWSTARAALLVRREVRESLGDLRLLFSMVALTLVIPVVAALGVDSATLFRLPGPLIERLDAIGAFFVVFLPASFSLVLALEAFTGERERQTLEVLLSTPLGDRELYLGKMTAVLIQSLSLSLVALLIYSLASFLLIRVALTWLLGPLCFITVGQAMLMIAGALLISANARTQRAANVQASFVILPMSGVIQSESLLIVSGQVAVLVALGVMIWIFAVALTRIGLLGLNRESLLSRENSPRLTRRRAGRALATAWGGSPGNRGLAWLYRSESWRAAWRCRWGVLIAALAFPASVALGAATAHFGWVGTGLFHKVVDTSPPADIASWGLVLFIFGHNLLAAALVVVLGFPSLGASGVLVVAEPGFLIGFLAGSQVMSPSRLLLLLVPHGVIEVPAIILVGGAVLRLGAALITPPRRGSWGTAVAASGLDVAKVLALAVVLLAAAAVVEGQLTARLAG